VSGRGAHSIVRKLAPFFPEAAEAHRAYVGVLCSVAGKAIDEVLILSFLEGRSFTGQESAEIFCHGSPAIVQIILTELVKAGGKVAEKGEFTFRAFLNGNVDLIQAEGVLQLIHSESEFSAKQALNQLKGSLSQTISKIEADLIWCLAHIEAGIDFSENEIDTAEVSTLIKKLQSLEGSLVAIGGTYRSGRLVSEGLKIVLSGRPNAGKSSVLNMLAGIDRAIVSSHAGTTRDTIEVRLKLKNLEALVVDTAGLRQTLDEVEVIGIQKSLHERQRADLNIYLVAADEGLTPEDQQNMADLDPQSTLILVNKIDLIENGNVSRKANIIEEIEKFSTAQVLAISSLDPSGRGTLVDAIENFLRQFDLTGDGVLTTVRHQEQVATAHGLIHEALKMLAAGEGLEFVAIELKASLMALQKLLGKRFDDDVLDRVFKEFCLGK
jgi:tRNA modification GTPase